MLCHNNTVIHIFTSYNMHGQIFLLYVIHLKFVDISVFCFETTRVVRHTQYGDVRGKITSRLLGNKVEEFLGVPYAAPPVGNLRFKRPKNPKHWKPAILKTDSLPPACPQRYIEYVQLHQTGFNKTSEDCLYLNIYVPQVDSKSIPVLLFIHGGGNYAGMGAMFDGDILAVHGQIVVVTFNYRLGILGFYGDRDEGIEGNNGLLDQVKAMKWINDNIEFFNGDPSQVTIYGHSAGAANVGMHLVSDHTKGLFKYAVIHSGSPLAHWYLSECVQPSDIQHSVCKPGTTLISKRKTYEELMSESTYDIIDSEIHIEEKPLVFSIPLVQDDTYLTALPIQMFSCKQIHAESVLLLMAKDEYFPEYNEMSFQDIKEFTDELKDALYVEWLTSEVKMMFPAGFSDVLRKTYKEWNVDNKYTRLHVKSMVADIVFFTPMIKLADMITERSTDVFILSFDYVSEHLTGPDWQGIPHGWDVFYCFGVPLVGHGIHNYTQRDIKVADTTMTLISNFVKYGYLTLSGNDTHNEYNSSVKSYNKLVFDSGKPVVKAETHFRTPRIEFWYKYMYPEKQVSCSKGMKYKHSFSLMMICFAIKASLK